MRQRLSKFIIHRISDFFKVFKRVSWWSFRVSTPFSLLYLILLTDFHKNASFRPNMLIIWILHSLLTNKLKTTLKIESFSVGLHTHSFTHFPTPFPLEVSRWQQWEDLIRLTIKQSHVPWVHTKTGLSKVTDVVRPPGPWTTSGPLSRGCNQQVLPR